MSNDEVDVSPTNLPQKQDAGALVQVVASTQDVVAAFHAYQAAKEALLTPADYQTFREGGHERSFVKRSGWRKLAIAFGVSFTIVDKQQMVDDAGMLRYAEFTVRATAPNGRSSDGWGSCSADERCCVPGCTRRHRHCPAADGGVCHPANHFTKPRHDIPATAETRAKNRAAADLFGMGEVSAEEVTEEHTAGHDRAERSSDHDHRTPARRLLDAVAGWERDAAGGDIPPAEADAFALSVIRGSDAMRFVKDSQTVELEQVDVEVLRAVYRELHDIYTGGTP